MYDKKKTEILVYPQGKKDTSYTVPSTINNLYRMSTNNNPYLKTITIPSSVTDISDNAVGYLRDGWYFNWNYNKVSGFTIKGYKVQQLKDMHETMILILFSCRLFQPRLPLTRQL